ncbi:unnamed protein product, partial [Brassica oleracea]
MARAPFSHDYTHQVFPSFHGPDVRKTLLSHILKELKSMGINPFIDNNIERSKSIGPELKAAIRRSRMALVLLSRNYASSSWCLDELVEIMECRAGLGQTVMTVFYEVDPTDVKKQRGDFGRAFKNTCVGRKHEEIAGWKRALAEVATIAGEHSTKWDDEAAMIEKIAADISNKLNFSMPSSDFNNIIGMRDHMDKMDKLLCLDSSEVRMIGIWGPSGIGKTTIARHLVNQISGDFQHSIFVENIKASMYTRRPCSDDYTAKLQLQEQFLSQICPKDVKIGHLRAVRDRLYDKKVLVVLDGVDEVMQLEAVANETSWFGRGSRIIITTQDQKVLRSHGIEDVYRVDSPPPHAALQIFCQYAFRQTSPYAGFEKLATKVTDLVGELPLALKVMGSHFRGMSMMEWEKSLPRLTTHLDGSIARILKLSYDALDMEDQKLFLHIACFFNNESIAKVEGILAHSFSHVRSGLDILAEKSLISITNSRYIEMHKPLQQLGRDIVRQREPERRQFLVDTREIREVLSNDTGSGNVIGIKLDLSDLSEDLDISERAFEGLSNLQFLRFHYRIGNRRNQLHLPRGLNNMPSRLMVLHWDQFPGTCLPSDFNPQFLVELTMNGSMLEKLWEGTKAFGKLKWMNLSSSVNLKEIPDLSHATSLKELVLSHCSSLVELPSSIGNAINLQNLDVSRCSRLVTLPDSIGNLTSLKILYLNDCSNLVELPSTIGNAYSLEKLDLSNCSSLVRLPCSLGKATNLKKLKLVNCSSLVELPSSIGNLCKLQLLSLKGCSKLEVLPININMESLYELDLTDCSLLKSFPQVSTCIRVLRLKGTAIKEMPSSTRFWCRLTKLQMSYSESLMELPHALSCITELHLGDTEIQHISPWVKEISNLRRFVLDGCRKVVSLPQLSDSLSSLHAANCGSLERLDCSFHNPQIRLNFANCFRLNKEAIALILHTSTRRHAVFPGGEVPAYFTYRATGSSLMVKLNERPLPVSLRFKACILPISKVDDDTGDDESLMSVYITIMEQHNGLRVPCKPRNQCLPPPLTGHLYTFEIEAKLTSTDLTFEFNVHRENWEIGECGVFE